MAPTPWTAPPRMFYGWWVVLALSVIVFRSAGVRFAIGPFLDPVSAQLGLDRGTFSRVISLSHQAGAALGSWLGGALFDPTGGYGAAFSAAGALPPMAAGLDMTIDETARPVGRVVALPGRPHRMAGGR